MNEQHLEHRELLRPRAKAYHTARDLLLSLLAARWLLARHLALLTAEQREDRALVQVTQSTLHQDTRWQILVLVGVVTELVEGDVYHWGALMAGALLGSLPVAVMYSFFVDYYVSGMTGAVKD
jgi:uncharacterized membrane protein YobD (UPF0266 family)